MINKKSLKTAIIPIAGKGTRFLPVTKAVFKTMFPIINKPTIQYIIEEAVSSGINHIIIVINETQNGVKDYFNNNSIYYQDLHKDSKELHELEQLINNINIEFVIQKEPRGLGDALLCCEQAVNGEDFVVLLGDDLVISNFNKVYGIGDLIKKYEEKPGYYIGVQQVAWSDTYKYGIIKAKDYHQSIMEIIDMIEKPKDNPPSNFAGVGRYILRNNVFAYLREKPYDGQHEVQLTDAFISAMKKEPVYASCFNGTRYDIGDKAGYVKANIAFALEDDEIKTSIKEFIDDLSK